MLNTAFSLLLAAAAGVSIVVQQVLNARLRAEIDSAAWSGFSSYLVGLVCMAVLAMAMGDPIPTGAVARIPWWSWSGDCSARSSSRLPSLSCRSSAPRPSLRFWSRARCWRR
jgi:uncharacterized membrane protein YdcZ (DUF606 family)